MLPRLNAAESIIRSPLDVIDSKTIVVTENKPAASFVPEFLAPGGERKTAVAADFGDLTPDVATNALSAAADSAYLIQWRAKAAVMNCKVLRVVEQSNPAYGHPDLPTDAGRCQSIAAIHAFSQLHRRPEVWDAYVDPANRHLGFSMIQRGGQHAEQYEQKIVMEKLHALAKRNPSWMNTLKGWAGMVPDLNPAQQSEFRNFADERVRIARLSFVPGSRSVACEALGQQLNLANMVASLPPGVHLLKLTVADGGSHMLSCNISDRTDIASRLMDPNGCEWEGHEVDLGRLLQNQWEELNLIDRWCRNGNWQRLTFGLGVDLDESA